MFHDTTQSVSSILGLRNTATDRSICTYCVLIWVPRSDRKMQKNPRKTRWQCQMHRTYKHKVCVINKSNKTVKIYFLLDACCTNGVVGKTNFKLAFQWAHFKQIQYENKKSRMWKRQSRTKSWTRVSLEWYTSFSSSIAFDFVVACRIVRLNASAEHGLVCFCTRVPIVCILNERIYVRRRGRINNHEVDDEKN